MPLPAPFHTSPAVTITTNGNTGPLNNLSKLQAMVPVVSALLLLPQAPTGTSPTLTFSLDVSQDGTNWFSVATTAPLTAAGNVRLVASNVIEPFVRLSWTVGGTTPSFGNVKTTILFN